MIEQAFKKLFGDMYLADSKTAKQIFEHGYKAGMEEAKNHAAWAKHLKEPMSEKRVHESDTNEPWDTTDMAHRPGGLSVEQEPVTWRNAAIRLGEDLYSVGPNGYYDMTASQWLDWALSVVNTAPPKQPKPTSGNVLMDAYNAMVDKKRQALDQPEQEPVAWRYKICPPHWTYSDSFPNKEFAGDAWDRWQVTPLYTAPPKREWVELTDEEEIELDEKYGDDFNAYIEARDTKLKEKNRG